ncbi:MAG TPA: glycosyltransferase [Bacteroidales bacterium]|nr:glycosyltransferase [Bacteroidales bacterium]
MNQSRNTRICLFNSSKIWGGGEKWHYETARKLSERGFDPIVFSHPQGMLYQKSAEAGIRVIPVTIRNLSFLNPLKILLIWFRIRREKTDTMIAGLPCDMKVAAAAARLAGVKKIMYRRGTALPLKNNLINRILYKHLTDAIIVNSREIKNILVERNARFINEDKIHLIYNEVDLQHPLTKSQTKKLSVRSNGEVILGNIGRLVEQKGQKYLIELAHNLKKQNLPFRILIAGSGKLKESLKSYARRLEVEEEVVFMDFIDDIHAFIHEIDIFVFPSLHEGSSHTLLEVMAARKPVVAFNISSIPEIIEHNKNGLLVETGNSKELFQQVHQLIRRKDLQSTFGDLGREKVEKQFNSDQGINKLIGLLQ